MSPRLRTVSLLALSAVLIVASSHLPFLCWIALGAWVPALCVLQGRGLRAWIGGGALLYFFVALGAYYWIFDVTYHFGGLPFAAAVATVPVFGLLNIWQGLVGFALFRFLAPRWPRFHAPLFAICVVAAWHWIPALFSWDISLLVLPWRWLIQSIDLFGTTLLDCVIMATNYAVFMAWREKRMTRMLGVALATLVVLNMYGALRCHQLRDFITTAPTARLALVQPNFDSDMKSDPHFMIQAMHELLQLSNTAALQHPDLIVWPESVFPMDYARDTGLQQILSQAIANWNTALMFGGTSFAVDASGHPKAYNVATLIQPNASAQSYRKHVLLAFGEYLPFESTFPAIRRWFPDRVGQFGRGEGATAFHFGTGNFAPVICYESIVSEYVRRIAQLPVDFVVEITNDGWYGRTAALAYHKDLARLRAIENHISIARDTNTGVTSVIDPLGNEHEILPLEISTTALYNISRARPFTLFTAGGFWSETVIGLIVIVLLLHKQLFPRLCR